MRGRRVGRCIERATGALDLGRIDDAREAVDEAKELSPDAPEIAELEKRIASHPSALAVVVAAEQPYFQSDPGWLKLGGMALLAVLFALAGFGVVQFLYTGPAQRLLSLRGATSALDDVRPTPNVPISSSQEVAIPSSLAQPVEENPPVTVADPMKGIQEGMGQTTHPPPPVAVSRPGTRIPAASSGDLKQSRGVAAPAAAVPPRSLLGNGMGLPNRLEAPAPITKPAIKGIAVPTTASVSPAPAAAAVANAISADSTPDVAVPAAYTPPVSNSRQEESARIRSVLRRYETAYNDLDAKAAGSVWPGVDQRALGRAFNGLRSQKVSLGLCEITVIGNVGGASCAGQARWEPKIGGGMETADRYWTFNLRKTGQEWTIQELRVR